MKQYEQQLKNARDAYERRLREIADEVREKLVVPFCEKHGLRFIGGIGDWCFAVGASGGYLEAEDDWLIDEAGMRAIHAREILEVLSLETTDSTNELGCWIESYRPKEKSCPSK